MTTGRPTIKVSTAKRPATLADVARLAGVVAMTASRALINPVTLVRTFVNGFSRQQRSSNTDPICWHASLRPAP